MNIQFYYGKGRFSQILTKTRDSLVPQATPSFRSMDIVRVCVCVTVCVSNATVAADSVEFPSLRRELEELLQQQGLHVDTRDEVYSCSLALSHRAGVSLTCSTRHDIDGTDAHGVPA